MFRKVFFTLIVFLVTVSVLFCKVETTFAVSSAIKNLSETAVKGFTNGSLTVDGDMDASNLNKFTEEKLKNTGVMFSLSAGIGSIIGAGLAFLGILFLLLIIYGGFLWMFARGNEQEIEKSKLLLEAAVTGLAIIIAAYAITSLLGSSFTNN